MKDINGTKYTPTLNTADNPVTIDTEAPSPAAEDSPNVYGLASLLFNIVCMIPPLKPSATPAKRAIQARGKRMSIIITCVVISNKFLLNTALRIPLRAISSCPIDISHKKIMIGIERPKMSRKNRLC